MQLRPRNANRQTAAWLFAFEKFYWPFKKLILFHFQLFPTTYQLILLVHFQLVEKYANFPSLSFGLLADIV
ncbi:hypothetical protein T09_889 [Trichinella sp. T9]|nr:hypothetical protein T09_889 [Trichinella sp. T9]